MDLFSIYKLGNVYKYTKIKDFSKKNQKDDIIKLNTDENYDLLDEKLSNNIIRATSIIKDLIICNDFKYFCTFTFNDNYNRYDLDDLRKKFNKNIRNIRYRYGVDIAFVLVPERHKSGAWHFHGVFNSSIEQFFYVNEYGYDSCSIFDKFGYNSFSEIRDKMRVASYVTKYMTKGFEVHEKGKHIFFTSHNLQRPQLVYSQEFDYNTIKDSFFDYSNNYCSVKYSDKYYNFVTKHKLA